jgi:hypothetical protein
MPMLLNMTPEDRRAYARYRYAERCKSEEYRQKVRDWRNAAIERKADEAQPKKRGRPRKYPGEDFSRFIKTVSVSPVESGASP